MLFTSELSSLRYTHAAHFRRRLDDNEDVDDTASTTSDDETDFVSYNRQALTKARFVKTDVTYFTLIFPYEESL